MEEHSNATVHGMVVEVSPIKASRKNRDVKYFSGKITDGKKVARVISFDPKLRSLCSAVSIAVLSIGLCLSNITSLSSSVSIALVSLCLSRIIFNLSSLLSSLHIAYLPLSLSITSSISLSSLTSLSSLVSAARLALSLSLLLIHNEQCKHMAFSNFIDKIKRYLRNTRIKNIYGIRTKYKHTNIYIYNANFSATSLVWGSLRLAPIIVNYNICSVLENK